MTQGFIKYVFMLTFFVSPSLHANADIVVKICGDTKYLKCMGTNTKECIAAKTKATSGINKTPIV